MDKLKEKLENVSKSNIMVFLMNVGTVGAAIAFALYVGDLLDTATSNTGNPSQYVARLTLAGIVLFLALWVLHLIRKNGQLGKLKSSIDSMNATLIRLDDTIVKMEANIQNLNCRTEQFDCFQPHKQEDRCHQIIINKLDEQSHFKYDTDDVTEELKAQLTQNTKINRLKIICYGRSGYQDVIRHIARLNRDIRVELIMFNTENDRFISRENDKEYIDRHIKDLKSRKKDVDVYVSDDPPMLRASALYEGDTPVWTAVQSYQLRYREERITEENKTTLIKKLDLHRPDDDSLIIICDKKSSKTDFDGVIHYFNREFNRLMSNSKEVHLTTDGGIVYHERRGLTPKGCDACAQRN